MDSLRTFPAESTTVVGKRRTLPGRVATAVPAQAVSVDQLARKGPQLATLKKGISWTLASSVVYAGCQWGIIVVLARLGPEYVGQFALGVAIAAPVMLFTNLHLRIVEATDASGKFGFHSYLRLRILSTAIALLAILGIGTCAGYSRETFLVIMAVGIAKAVESFSDIYYGLLQRHEQMDAIACSMMFRGLGALAMLSAVVYLTGSVIGGVVAMSGVWLFALVAFDIPSGKRMLGTTVGDGVCQPRVNLSTLGQLAWTAFPVGLIASVISLELNVPRYFLESMLGEAELGIFAAIAFVVVAASTVINAIHQPVVPRLANYFAQSDAMAFRRLVLKLAGFGYLWGGCGILVASLIGSRLLNMIYGPEYGQHHSVFVLLMVAGAIRFGSLAIGSALRAMHRFWMQSVVHLPGLAVIVIVCPLLVSQYGLLGAAYAFLIVAILEALIYGWLAVWIFRHLQARVALIPKGG